jgi:hypothetical protein
MNTGNSGSDMIADIDGDGMAEVVVGANRTTSGAATSSGRYVPVPGRHDLPLVEASLTDPEDLHDGARRIGVFPQVDDAVDRPRRLSSSSSTSTWLTRHWCGPVGSRTVFHAARARPSNTIFP